MAIEYSFVFIYLLHFYPNPSAIYLNYVLRRRLIKQHFPTSFIENLNKTLSVVWFVCFWSYMFVNEYTLCLHVWFMHIQYKTKTANLQNWAIRLSKDYCCLCSSPDSLKLGFRCTQKLVVRILWAMFRLVSFAHSWMCLMIHFNLTRNSRGSYSIITSTWPRVLAGFPY